jgi:hypothetical protein
MSSWIYQCGPDVASPLSVSKGEKEETSKQNLCQLNPKFCLPHFFTLKIEAIYFP